MNSPRQLFSQTHLTRFLATALGALVICLTISGCNTTRGAGQDVKELGQAVQNSAEKHGAEN